MFDEKGKMRRLAEKLGLSLASIEEEIELLHFNQLNIVDLMPEMLLMVRSLIASRTFTYKRKPIGVIEEGLLISFQNIFITEGTGKAIGTRALNNQPHVRIMPLHVESDVVFPRDVHVQQITILVELEYLKHFVGNDADRLFYLFDVEKTFWIEEFMSPEMSDLVAQLANLPTENILSQAFYRLKSLELIYWLFSNLLKREKTEHHHLSNAEIDTVYLVRNTIESNLEKPLTKDELVKLSGINELKLRRIFTQVFGKGIHEYYNHLRMQKAASLLKQEALSVSEVGYRLGFSNLSYFGRLFEKHFGLKPKKWSDKNKI
ncbi:helix-turn-helix transcriptional regulator [Pedobacter sp. GR22-6]|uniref:helix-turn-helix transcriptional regulator n=1 Tax=Pedobacter sp. GR22-6 TaxID=3127957 RepID=UPI00307DA206